MKILLIGNFAPPYEEENLHNISLLYRLEKDGHKCTVINISEEPSGDKKFIEAKSFPAFMARVVRHSFNKDVVHFLTKGYLRVGLLKLMMSIFFGRLFRAKTIVTFHSELFSILGQMRSPFGGTQTLLTSFLIADKIIFTDKDTYEVAAVYRRKPNFELVPSFVHVPEEVMNNESLSLTRLKSKEKVIIFSNVKYPSFIFDTVMDLVTAYHLPSDIGIVISLSEKPSAKYQHVIADSGRAVTESLIFVESNNIQAMLMAFSKADIIIRPLSCDGTTYFESFALSVKKLIRSEANIYFSGGLVLVKEGKISKMCVNIFNSMLSSKAVAVPELEAGDPYTRIMDFYKK